MTRPRPSLLQRPPCGPALVLAVVCALSGGGAHATSARLAALGGGAYLEDDANVLRWYGSVVDYPDALVLDLGHFTLPEGWHDTAGARVSGPALGAHVQPDSAGVWGVIAAYWHERGDDTDPGSLARDRLGATGTLVWGRRFGAVQPALLVRASRREDVNPYNRLGTRTEFGAGLRWDVADGAYLDLAGETRRHEETVTEGPGVDTAGGDGLGLRARAFLRVGEHTALVPLLDWIAADRPVAAPAADLARSVRGQRLQVGAGLNWYPDPDHVMVVSAEHAHTHVDLRGAAWDDAPAGIAGRRRDTWALAAGFESRFRHWLMFRGSFRYADVSEVSADGAFRDDWARFTVNLGAAVQLGPADLDLAICDREPRPLAGDTDPALAVDPSTWLGLTLRWRY
ncbi:hypothetical protein KDM41_11450 [bacterium]|nr:hypothetical protein [bacterium]